MATRSRPTTSAGIADPLHLRFGGYALDQANARLTFGDVSVGLAPKAFEVLCVLARSPGQLVTKAELLDAVWGHQHVSESVLKTVVSELREMLGDDPKAPSVIETVPRRGYRFIAAVGAPPAAASPADGPAPAASGAGLVGRRVSLDRLAEAWAAACAGTRQVVWVAGEAGIGKTTLVGHFAAGLGDVRVAHGQCVEQHGAAEPYLPVLEALASLCREDPSVPPLVRSVAPTWMLQLPWLGSEADRAALHRELASAGQERMLREFGELLERCTESHPLLIVTEDLHWSDAPTLGLIDHVARRRGRARVMWLSTFRLAEVIAFDHPLKSLRHELRLHRLCHELRLDPFSEQDVADFLGQRMPGAAIAEPVVRELHARTEGLPLFLASVLEDFAGPESARPFSPDDIARALAQARIPENLAGVIEAQAARLPPEQQALLQAASVCGSEFWLAALPGLLGRDLPWTQAACEQLARHGHWLVSQGVARQPDGVLGERYAFRHALYREVFYEGIGAMRRIQWHRGVAQWLGRTRDAGGSVALAELALHHERSHDFVRALPCHAEAAQAAMRRFAPGEALSIARHGMALLGHCPAGPERDALELVLVSVQGAAAAQAIGVGAEEARESFEHARKLLAGLPGHPLRGMVLHAFGIVLLVRGEYDRAIGLGEQIYAVWQEEHDPLLLLSACSVMGQALALQGRNRLAADWLSRGVAACESTGDEALHAAFMVDPAVTIHAALAIPLLHLGRAGEARRHHDAAMVRARKLREPMALLVAHWFGALLELRLGNAARVAELARDMAALAESAALLQGQAPSLWFGGWAMAHQGAPREGAARILEAHDRSGRGGMRSGGAEVLAYAAEAWGIAGDWSAATRVLEDARELARSLGEEVYLVQMQVLGSRIARGAGRVAAAREALQEAVRIARAQEAPWLELMVRADLWELGDDGEVARAALRELCSRIEPVTDSPLYQRASRLAG